MGAGGRGGGQIIKKRICYFIFEARQRIQVLDIPNHTHLHSNPTHKPHILMKYIIAGKVQIHTLKIVEGKRRNRPPDTDIDTEKITLNTNLCIRLAARLEPRNSLDFSYST